MAHIRNTASALLAAALVAICCLTLTQQALADGLRVDDRMNSRQDRRDQTEDRSDDRSERVDERF
jgi:hypothetical protein